METKFHLLAVGQHFEWEGKRYVKTTPLIANQLPEGGQKFMPRAALVSVVGTAVPSSTVAAPATLDSAKVRDAIARYHQRSLEASLVGRLPHQEELLDEVKHELEQIYRELLDELKL